APRPALPEAELTKAEREALWDDLAGPDALRAYRAVLRLARGGKGAVAFLAARVLPTPGPTPERVAALLADLDGSKFIARAQAETELARLGEAVRPYLRKALEGKVGEEGRRRIERLLALPAKPQTLADRLAEARAVE